MAVRGLVEERARDRRRRGRGRFLSCFAMTPSHTTAIGFDIDRVGVDLRSYLVHDAEVRRKASAGKRPNRDA